MRTTSDAAAATTVTLILALTIIALIAAPVTANVKISLSGDTRKTVELGTFGYSEGGVIRFKISALQIKGLASPAEGAGSALIPSTAGFAVDTVDTAQSARSERDYSRATAPCFVDDDDLKPKPPDGARLLFFLNGTQTIDYSASNGKEADFTGTIPRRGLYSIFFFNCLKLNKDGGAAGATTSAAAASSSSSAVPAVTMRVHIDQYNVDSAGQRNYLSLGEQPLGSVYLVFFFFYAALFVVWRRLMGSKSQHVKRVHSVVQVLLVVKTLSVFFETFKYFHYARTGESNVWDLLFYVFLTLKALSLFTVIVLLGSGWSSAKAFLSQQDKNLLLFLLPAQVVINIIIAVLQETSEGNWWWGRLLDLFRLLDILCLLAVLLPLVWSMKNLREAAEHEEKAAVNLHRMRTFRTFYLVFVGYIYATRVLLVVIAAMVPFYMVWTASIFKELCAALLYSYICYAFQPGPASNPYEVLDPEAAANEIAGEELERREELQAPPEDVVVK